MFEAMHSVESLPHIDFAAGTLVRERDSHVMGKILGPGKHPGEWRVKTALSLVMCLDSNLQVVQLHSGQAGIGAETRAAAGD
jgi:hypothetical protein